MVGSEAIEYKCEGKDVLLKEVGRSDNFIEEIICWPLYFYFSNFVQTIALLEVQMATAGTATVTTAGTVVYSEAVGCTTFLVRCKSTSTNGCLVNIPG